MLLIIFITVFTLDYLGLLAMEPILCAEASSTSSSSESSEKFIGVHHNIIASTILAVSGVVGTLPLAPAVKMKVLAASNIVGVGGIVAVNKVASITDWKAVRAAFENSSSSASSSTSNSFSVSASKASILPFEMNYNSFLHWFTETFPVFTSTILQRLPEDCGENFTITYQTLFTQYNIMVLLAMIFLSCIIGILLTITLLSVIENSKAYLLLRFPKSLGKFSNSHSFQYVVLICKIGLMLNIAALYQAIYFIYSNPIPSNIGNLTDLAIQNMTS